jgi:hypothetical protein
MLALGVALEAVVGSKSALPGRIMAQRYALLEADIHRRREKVARYNDVYSVRSAVAHGRESSKIDESEFVRCVADDVRWAARRLYALGDLFGVKSDEELDRTFEALALGERTWS